jgi:hypothetical protein
LGGRAESLVPAAALNQHIAILGKTGSGKTYAAKGLVEGMLRERRQVCIIDPTAAWWGLRLAAGGKDRGFDVVLLGGDRGDVPLTESSGAAVARLVTQQRASVVIDTSSLMVGQYSRWFFDFASTLFATIRSPLHLVIDEAHQFMPQAGGGARLDPQAARMLHAGNRLMSGGRSRGIAATLITQRPAKLHKDSLTCADVLIAMRVLAPQDRAAVKAWIDGAGDARVSDGVLGSLANLARGEGWVWYPEGGYLERVRFPKIGTFDSSASPTRDGQSAPAVAEIDLGDVKAAMAEAIRESEQSDPAALRRRIVDLEKRLSAQSPAGPPAVVEKIVRDERVFGLVRSGVGTIRELCDRIASAAGEVLRVCDVPPARAAARPAPEAIPDMPAAGGLAVMERALLTVLAQHPAGLSKQAALLMAGYQPSGHVSAAWAKFAAGGWTIRTAGGVRIAPAGLAALGHYDPLPTGDGLRDYWLKRLDRLEAELLRVLFDSYPDAISKTECIQRAGYSPSGHVSAAWAKFQRLGFIARTANGVRASAMWFEG